MKLKLSDLPCTVLALVRGWDRKEPGPAVKAFVS